MSISFRPTGRAGRGGVPADLVVASLIVATAVLGGATALWVGRDNVAPKPPDTRTAYPLTDKIVPVPQLVGLSNPVALIGYLLLARLNYALVDVKSKTVPYGVVITQSPAPGTPVRQGTVVQLTRSRGP